MVLRNPGRGNVLEMEERREPRPTRGEVLLRIAACGVCRTDLQLCRGDLASHRTPVVPGHQIVGRIDAVGPGVTERAIGDRVGVAWIAGSCGTCSFCEGGRENLCRDATFTGWDRDGGFATHTVARADFTTPLPDGFADLDAAPLLCGGVIGYRSWKLSGIEPGGRLGLYGFGASATCVIQVAVANGCQVFVATRSKSERERAEKLGAVWTGAYEDRPPAPLDAAITFAPAGDVVGRALEAVDRGGTVAINAIHLDHVPEFAYEKLWHERQLRSVANVTREDVREFLELCPKIGLRTRVEVFPLDRANEALARLEAGRVSGAAVLSTG